MSENMLDRCRPKTFDLDGFVSRLNVVNDNLTTVFRIVFSSIESVIFYCREA